MIVVACREVPMAPAVAPPPPPAPYVTFGLDTIHGGLDVGGAWWSTSLFLGPELKPDQRVHIVSLDGWRVRLRYHGCSNFCDDPAHWFHGTADSAFQDTPYNYGASGASLTADGLFAIYSIYSALPQGPNVIRYAHCGGGCNFTGGWAKATEFSGRGFETGPGPWDARHTPLAADPAGGLNLLLFGAGLLHFGYCAAACDSTASWQEVLIDSTYPFSYQGAGLVTVAPSGTVHVIYGSTAGLIHATCAAHCTIAGSWQSAVAVPGVNASAIATAFGPDGRMHAAYVDGVYTANYATCAAPCAAPDAWSVVGLPLRTRDVALATDRSGGVFLATTYRTVALSRCPGNCLDPMSWQSTTIDSALGGGRVAIAVDSAGRARIASSDAFGLLQYTQVRQ